MKCQNLSSGKNKKKKLVCHLLKILPRLLSVKGQFYVYSGVSYIRKALSGSAL